MLQSVVCILPSFISIGMFDNFQHSSNTFAQQKNQAEILKVSKNVIKRFYGRSKLIFAKIVIHSIITNAVLIGSLFLTEYFFQIHNGKQSKLYIYSIE